MAEGLRYLLQALNYFVFMALVGYFSMAPPYRHLEGDEAQVTLAFGHAGKTREVCRKLSAEELQRLPPNMRNPEDCPRERSPVIVELLMDGEMLLEMTANAPGVFEDGAVDIFRSVRVPAGSHSFEVRMDDSVRVEGFTRVGDYETNLERGRVMVVGFNPEAGFLFN